MRFVNRRLAVALGAALVLTVCVNALRAGQPAEIEAYDPDGEIVDIEVLALRAGAES